MRVHPTRLAIVLAIATLTACEQHPTEPNAGIASFRARSATVITPGLSVYTDRAEWEAAVATAGGTVVNMDFSALTPGKVTQLVTDYGDFGIVIDEVAGNSFYNPGISVTPDGSCSLGIGDCEVFTLGVIDPITVFDAPKVNKLGFPQDVIAFGGDYIQTGYTSPDGTPTGTVTLRIGSESVAINPYVSSTGNGFFGFVATASDTVTYTFVKSGSIFNDVFQIYNPAYAEAPEVSTEIPAEMIADLRAAIGTLGYTGGTRASMDSKLVNALAALNASNVPAACSALQDLINHVRAQRGKRISASNASLIIAATVAIRAELGC